MSVTAQRALQRGYGNDERPVVDVLWRRDSRGPNTAMQAHGNYEPDHREVDYRRYYDADYYRQELENVWMKQWLFACREEDIPNVGDRVPFDVGPLSFMIVRSKTDEFKAFYNSCLHRGTMLCAKPESGATIRCPYHGWEWNADGTLKRIPSHWDFTDITRANGSLREVKLGRWGGFVFINADPDCGSLEESLGVVPAHFDAYGMERRYTAARFRKLIAANWKVAQEAFMESYHLYATHPEGVPYNGDSQSAYDIWTTPRGAVGRLAVPSAVPSMHAGPEASQLVAGDVFAQIMRAWHYPDAELPALDPGKDIRTQCADWHRKVQERVYGRKVSAPDGVMLDSTLYFVYPQFCVWMSESIPFVYQFTPHATDPQQCYFEVRLMRPVREGEEAPPSSPAVFVDTTESIAAKVPAFNFLAMIFDQDMGNMPLVQRGLRAADPARHHAFLGAYQESMIQHWHELYDRDMAK